MNMKKMAMILMVALVVLVTGCSDKYKKAEKQMKQPINCATAIFPAGAVVGVVTKTEGTKLKVATGEYDKMIDKRIAEIKAQCGVQ